MQKSEAESQGHCLSYSCNL